MQNYAVKLNGTELEIVDSLTYLDIVFKYKGNVFDARKKLVEQSQNSLFTISTRKYETEKYRWMFS